MNNVIMRQVPVTSEFAPLSSQKLVGTFEISTPPTNTGNVIFKGDNNTEVVWVPGEFHTVRRINLAEIQAKGQAGDVISIVGGTW